MRAQAGPMCPAESCAAAARQGLAGTAPLARLAASVPAGLQGGALVDALLRHRVPVRRAAWLVRVTALRSPRCGRACCKELRRACKSAFARARLQARSCKCVRGMEGVVHLTGVMLAALCLPPMQPMQLACPRHPCAKPGC